MNEIVMAYLWVQVVDSLNGILYASKMDVPLNLLPVEDRFMLLNGFQVGFARESFGSCGIALSCEIIKNQEIDITKRRRQC